MEYPRANQDKLRGVIWNALSGTRHDSAHDEGVPVGVSISNIFPWSETIPEDEIRHLIVASPHEDALSAIVRAHPVGSELNIGELPFEVVDAVPLEPDVGEPGSTGTLETSTGVYTRLPDELCESYGIEAYETGDTFWSSESSHPLGAFVEYIEHNLQIKHDLFHFPHLDGPKDVSGDLFEAYELQKEFVVRLPVTQDRHVTAVLTRWKFEYRIRDDAHRRHLNLALDTGLGGRNTLGLGFVNLVDDDTGRALSEPNSASVSETQ